MLLKRADKPKDKYDCIVIGAGLGGMTCANVLGKRGKKVLLLEAHNKLGGLATWFWRHKKEHIFDVSLHGFPYGMVKTCRKYWGKDIASDIVQLNKIRFINPQFNIETTFDREDFSRHLIETFKVPAEQVEAFFDYIFKMNFYDLEDKTAGDLFERFFPGRSDVLRFLMEPITYANGSGPMDPAQSYAIVFSNFMSKGVYTFTGGTDQLIFKMRDELVKNGVDIKMHSKVEDIVVEASTVRGVVLKGELVRADAVISNGNLKTTIFDLVGAEHFVNADFVEKAQAIRLNSSSCQVYMGLKKDYVLPEVGDLIFTSKAPEYSLDKILDFQISSRTFSVYYPESRPDHGRATIVSSTNAHYDDWKKLSKEQYAVEKQKMIDETIEDLEKIIPGVGAAIEFVDAATPLTVERYTHHPKGTSFGTKFESLDLSMKLHKEVGGLFHTGSVGIIMSGWLGAANYGVIAANEVENFMWEREQALADKNLAEENAEENKEEN